MKVLSKAQIMLLHEQLIDETGGSHGIRDEGMLESALAAPFQEFGGTAPFPTVQQKAARLGYGLVMNHPFIDGNKRIGAHATLVLLALNGIEIGCTQEELAEIILRTASGATGYEALLSWLLQHQLLRGS